MKKNIYYELYDNENTLVYKEITKEQVIKKLLEETYNILFAKSLTIKRKYYKYNYTDLQRIKIIYNNNWYIIFYNIPTKMGLFDPYEL